MSIEGISKASLSARVANTGRGETNQVHVKKTDKDDRFVSVASEPVAISKESGEFGQTIASLKASLSEMPEIRVAKMEEVKEKLENGFYGRREVVEQAASSIIDAFSIK